MGKVSLIRVMAVVVFSALFASCGQSLFQVLTHDDVGYWSHNWTFNEPVGSIMEFTKKDSTMKYLDGNWNYDDITPAYWGLKFSISNDSLFWYVNRNGCVRYYDTLSIVSYSRNTIVSQYEGTEYVKLHRISTKYAQKMIYAPTHVKLSSLLRKKSHDAEIKDIGSVVWKLYGYGDMATGMVRKSESLKNEWMSFMKLWKNGALTVGTTHNHIYGEYIIHGSNIVIMNLDKGGGKEDLDGCEFRDTLPLCRTFKITNNWLQLFYDDGKKYLLFKFAPNWVIKEKNN